jgi:hypothetical protein
MTPHARSPQVIRQLYILVRIVCLSSLVKVGVPEKNGQAAQIPAHLKFWYTASLLPMSPPLSLSHQQAVREGSHLSLGWLWG